MTKVEELVEWVATNLWEKEKRISLGWEYIKDKKFDELFDGTKNAFRKQAKQIVSHPDLALIDRDILTNPHTTISEMLDAITPLAEALKEE